ncbi:MAG: hypothetical protein ACREO0_14905 [Pseudoxanthomonas sp.]
MSKGYSRSNGFFLAMVMLLCFSAAAAAAPPDPSEFESAKLKQNIVIGKTTSSQIRAIYGKPESVHRASAAEGGYETEWEYTTDGENTAGKKAKHSVMSRIRNFIPLPANANTAADIATEEQGVGERKVKNSRLRISYDKKGVVTDYSLSEYNETKRFFE